MTNIERICSEQIANVREFKENLKNAADENLEGWPCTYLINGSNDINCNDCFLKSMRGCHEASANEVLTWLDSEVNK